MINLGKFSVLILTILFFSAPSYAQRVNIHCDGETVMSSRIKGKQPSSEVFEISFIKGTDDFYGRMIGEDGKWKRMEIEQHAEFPNRINIISNGGVYIISREDLSYRFEIDSTYFVKFVDGKCKIQDNSEWIKEYQKKF